MKVCRVILIALDRHTHTQYDDNDGDDYNNAHAIPPRVCGDLDDGVYKLDTELYLGTGEM